MGYPLIKDEYAYPGQVQLCPPDQLTSESDTNPALQVSMGIVSVYEHELWASLNENNSSNRVTHQQANSICQQMGFTGAVVDSIRTVGSYAGQYTFTNCQTLPR